MTGDAVAALVGFLAGAVIVLAVIVAAVIWRLRK